MRRPIGSRIDRIRGTAHSAAYPLIRASTALYGYARSSLPVQLGLNHEVWFTLQNNDELIFLSDISGWSGSLVQIHHAWTTVLPP